MSDRRYNETEVAEIFRRASEAQQGGRVPLASRDGMTLSALQEIGREVGLPPELVARAAHTLDRQPVAGTRRLLGLPVGVSRTALLDRKLSQREWEALVVDLRETFEARGNLREDGAFKQWTNGNLQALLEPVGDAHRLRLKTVHGAARGWIAGGAAILGLAAITGVASALGPTPIDDLWHKISSMALLGGAMFTAGALRLPGWARRRRAQMEAVTERVIGNR